MILVFYEKFIFLFFCFRCASYVGFLKNKAAHGQTIYLHEYCITKTPSNNKNCLFLVQWKSGKVQLTSISDTAQKLKFSIKDFSGKCDQIRRKLWIWSHLLEKSLMENLIFCAVRLLEFWSYFNWKSSLLLQYRRPKSSQFAVLH